MAKNRIINKPSVPPSKTPQQAIPLLTRQLERLEEASKLSYNDPLVAAWENTTTNLLNDVYGKPNGDPHDNTWQFEHGSGEAMTIGMDDYELQERFKKQQDQRKALLAAYVEQLTDQVSVLPVPSVVSSGAQSPKKPKELKTMFSTYQVGTVIGEGGAGLVYSAKDEEGRLVAIKILNPAKATSEKLKRFKNEFRFCMQSKHPNIVAVLDNGITPEGVPFFVMPLFASSLRKLVGNLSAKEVFENFKKIIEGVDAAHKQGVVHRDLKPENILVLPAESRLAVSDFGIADFEEDELYSTVETRVGAHIGNFQYAAPEQRVRGKKIDKRADIYSLGLILNELFTSDLALGVNFKTIASIAPEFAYLDPIVSKMLEQSPSARFDDIDSLKLELSMRSSEYISLQKISKLSNQVIPVNELDDPIVSDPIRVVGGDWSPGVLTIELSQAPTPKWIWAIQNMGSYNSVYGAGPEHFQFNGKKAIIRAQDSDAQRIVDQFKEWLPRVAQIYKSKLERDIQEEEQRKRDEIKRQIEEESRKLKVKNNLTF